MAKNITVIWNHIVSFLMQKDSKPQKTRDLHIYDFLEVLQIEYINAELRGKIYPNAGDKAFYREKVMYHKKKKIQDICSRNPQLPNIFNSEDEKKRIIDRVYGEWGLPNFYYKDDQHKTSFVNQDFYNYFMQDSLIRIRLSKESTAIGTLVKVDRKNNIAIVKVRGEEHHRKVSLDHIARIL